MAVIVKEVQARTVLCPSKVHPYTVNPYVGCQHACTYCYARFMKRVTGHLEPWGEFVDVKVNAADLLRREIGKKKRKGKVWVSGVCDPYQPLEARYRLTRQCLEILVQHDWPVVVQTRSPLILRDIEVLREAADAEVGLSVTTADDGVRRLFEPHAPPIPDRLLALDVLHRAGIRTFAMVAPVLPGAEGLGELLKGKIDHLLADRMNYRYADSVYRAHGFEYERTDEFYGRMGRMLAQACAETVIACELLC